MTSETSGFPPDEREGDEVEADALTRYRGSIDAARGSAQQLPRLLAAVADQLRPSELRVVQLRLNETLESIGRRFGGMSRTR